MDTLIFALCWQTILLGGKGTIDPLAVLGGSAMLVFNLVFSL